MWRAAQFMVLNTTEDAHPKSVSTFHCTTAYDILRHSSVELGKPFHWNHLIGSVNVPTYQYRCSECGRSFERTETISEHEAAQVRCPKCDSKKVTQIPGRVHVVTSKKS